VSSNLKKSKTRTKGGTINLTLNNDAPNQKEEEIGTHRLP